MLQTSNPTTWRSVQNLVPLPYRRVSVQPYQGPMTEEAITTLFLSREAYRRTDFIVLRGENEQTAIVAITRAESEPLFSQITSVEILALPETCVFIEREAVDPANRSALAEVAHELGMGPEGTLVVKGLYDHVNFIHHPNPLVVRVVEVAPPEPPKLYGLASYSTEIRAYRGAESRGKCTSDNVSRSMPLGWIRRPTGRGILS